MTSDPSTSDSAPSGAPARPARLIDVAQKAGVCRSTAAKVLLGTGGKNTRVSAQTQERVREAARALNFTPNQIARQLKGIRSKTLGLIVGYGISQVLGERLMLFEAEAFKAGYRLLLGHLHGDAKRARQYVDDFTGYGVDGIIAVHLDSSILPEVLPRLGAVPNVVLQALSPVPGWPCVVLDRAAGVREAVGHLVARGKRRIAIHLQNMTAPMMRDRFAGYLAGLQDAGIERDDTMVWVLEMGRMESLGGLACRFIRDVGADAMIMCNDDHAVQALKAVQKQGMRVPGELGIVGFDNTQAALASTPELTTIDQANSEVAGKTVGLLVGMIEGRVSAEEARRVVVVRPRLVVREST